MILETPERIKEYGEKSCWIKETLLDLFYKWVGKNPRKVALMDPPNKEQLVGLPPERITYEKLARAVEAVAASLKESGIRKDDVVVVQLPNTWELAMLYLAVCRAGGIISPLPMQWRAREFAYVAGITEAKAFITVKDFKGFKHMQMGKELQPGLSHLKQVVSLEEIREMAGDRGLAGERDKPVIDANDVFTICWTSGTEAEPKGCPLSHNNWHHLARYYLLAVGFKEEDIFLCTAPMVNMTGLRTGFIMPLLTCGGTVVLHHPFDIEICIEQIMREKVTHTTLVPAVLNMILKHPRTDEFDLRGIKGLVTGSAPPSLWSFQEFKRRWGIEIVNSWGQSEGTIIMAGLAEVPELERRVESIPDWGNPGREWVVKEVQTKLIDPETGQPVSEVGGVGELCYRGPGVIPRYFNQPRLTAKSFDEEGYFRTGDLFQIKEKHFIKFFERCKDIIIRGGFNISAQEVENILQGHPKVFDVAAVAMPDPVLGERTCIYVVPKDKHDPPVLAELVSFMKEKGVSVYKLPERLEVVDAIPRNAVGKILKRELKEDIRRKLEARY
ncbi:MAG: (2,3-dihydroxybenzoyl)adenylate synthase [Peptococcaceae bacterium]|nr:MAG: (2,3-dihydroxybenzoyl)adenylate synthase [Peptococcaceae bacterium]